MKAALISAMAVVALTAASMPMQTPLRADASAALAADTILIEVYASTEGLAFEPDEIRARAGSMVKLRLVNPSALPHNLVILLNEKDLELIGAASFKAAGTGFVPMEHKSKMAGYSTVAQAGKTVEFVFTVPATPGEYLFVCFVDGHFNVMNGKLRVYK